MKPLPSAVCYLLSALCALLSLPSALAQPQTAWVARYNGGYTNRPHTPLAAKLDNVGNLYVAGSSQNASNAWDYVLLKYAPHGQLLWAARHGATNGMDCTLRGFALDAGRNARLTGTGGTVAYDANGALAWTAPYAGRDVAVDTNGNTYVTGFSELDFVTAKLSPSGSNLWLRVYDSIWAGQHMTNVAQTVAVDDLGRVYVAGWEDRDAIPCGPTLICYNAWPVMLCYDEGGNARWTNAYTGGGSYWGETKGLIPDNQGNVYVTGNDGNSTYGTAAVNAIGQKLWGFSSGSPPGVMQMAVDITGNVYLTGGVLDFPNNVFGTFKLDDSGNVVWQATYRGNSTGYTVENRAYGIGLDSALCVYVTGVSTNSGSGNDFVTIKYGTNSHQLWVQRYNGPANGNDGATGIAVAPDGSIYVTGYSANANGGSDITTIKYASLTPIQKKSDGSIQLQRFGTPGVNYPFETTTNLIQWTDLGSALADSNGIVQFTDPNAPLFPHRFYRWYVP